VTHILHRSQVQKYPTAVSGHGLLITDSDGRDYIDASGGAAVSCLGHGNKEVLDAMRRQMDALEYAHTRYFTTDIAEELAALIIEDAPAGLSHVHICSSGSEAIEACLKIARHYFVERGELERTNIISRRQSYHGITLGALSVGGRMAAREPFSDMLFKAHHVSPCYAYRGLADGETEAAYGERLAHELEQKIAELGPETVAAFIAETVVGATLGAVTAVPGYFRRVREICDRHGILLILDEVMCGMGRTGTMHACEQEGIAPDLMAIAKGLGGGYAPIGAMLCAEKIVTTIAEGSGAFPHSQTYNGHPLACAAAAAVQKIIKRDRLLDNVKEQGIYLERRLKEHFGNHHHVGDVRGRGLFQGIELVADRSTKAPFDASRKLQARIKQTAMAHGLVVYPMGGTVDGESGDHVLLAPPFIITNDDVDEVVNRLGQAIDDALLQTGRD